MSYTRDLAEFAQALRPADIPTEVGHQARRVLLDCLGCGVAGLITPSGRIAVDLSRGERGNLQARIIGSDEASLMPAAFANTVLVGAIEAEPQDAEGHVPAVAVGAALAVADAVGASGVELLTALVAGLEVGGRIGRAVRRPSRSSQAGFGRGHSHVVFAATAAAGRLLGLSREQMHHAFGIGGYSANVPTLDKFLASPHSPMTKYDHLGLMAQNGIQAALLAARGFTGDLEVLEGDFGFWRLAGAPSCDWDQLTRALGSQWTIPEVAFKPYPAALAAQTSIDVASQVASEHGLRADEIEHIEIRSMRAEGPTTEVRSPEDAWRNRRYNVAAAVCDIRPRRSWQSPEAFRRSDVRGLMERIEFMRLRDNDVSGSGNYWEGWAPARAEIAARGRTFKGAVDYLRTMDDSELTAKFRENVAGLLADADAAALDRACWNLSQVNTVRQVTNLMQAIHTDA